MAGLLIIAHAPLASALKAVAQHTFSECAATVEAFDVTPDLQPADVAERALPLLERVRDPEVLILTDVFHATPCRGAQLLAALPQVRVVAGVNVPMLWRSLCYATRDLDALVELAESGGNAGVMRVPGDVTTP